MLHQKYMNFLKIISKNMFYLDESLFHFLPPSSCNIFCHRKTPVYNFDNRICKRHFHTSWRLAKEDPRDNISKLPKKDEGIEKGAVTLDTSKLRKHMFPDENTPDLLFDGVRFADLPVCNIRVSMNNTIMSVSTAKGRGLLLRSCGMDGFKHTKKGTNIAAQTTGISLAAKALAGGINKIRVVIKGLGPGRKSSVQGLQMGGLEIISITDNTPTPNRFPRPRKAKRI